MSNRHLPAGQNLQGGAGGIPGVDMGGGPGGHGGGPRRRGPPQYMHQYHQPMNQMYPGYVPYAPQQYYGMPPQYQNAAMPAPTYHPYQSYARSPPAMHQYVPMVGVSVPSNYPRPSQQSPALSTPYQPPPAPIPPQTPSSTHSSQVPPPPTPPTPQTRELVPESVPPPAQEPEPVTSFVPFRPPLPWYSQPDLEFPARSQRSRRRRRFLNQHTEAVSLPVEKHAATPELHDENIKTSLSSSTPAKAASSTTPSQDPAPDSTTATKAARDSAQPDTVTPVVPAVSKVTSKPTTTENQTEDKPAVEEDEVVGQDVELPEGNEPTEVDEAGTTQPTPTKAPPTSWANLFAKSAAAAAANSAGLNGSASVEATVNGGGVADTPSAGQFGGSAQTKANAVAEVIRAYNVASIDKVPFLEPRGLINTGNMCYMNSVLQVLMFCVPFHNFLDQVGKRAAHSFKSETPLVDAMIMFMQEYKAIKSAPSVDQLRRILKPEDLERYGEPFTPEFVYEAIRQLSRFASMRRGHQQDAEEFLGFLLQSLDDECTHVMSTSSSGAEPAASVASDGDDANGPSGDWLEVGRKQRAAVTRSSGSNSSTPITKIFGGLLRSEFRVPGLKDSITTEPYQPLQLDIGSPDVRDVVDALRGLTRPERLQGDFNSPRGKDVAATKQVFIESLPPVLILHLKRFQFDAEGNGTVKIWKKIGYPLELEIPREALSRQKRQTMGEGAMPKYKLISVVYHHGKNASGGHYTVDVRRQDGREWIRIDDTVIRRVRSEDVAEVGSEEEPKDTRRETSTPGASANRFGAINDEDTGDEGGWKQVTTSTGGNKRWSSVVNGASNGAVKGKQAKDNIKDNKVAYLLFYQRV